MKGGLQVAQGLRDIRSASPAFTFVGADGRASTTPVGSDDNAGVFRDAGSSSRTPPYGLPPIGVVDNNQLLTYYRANPSHFVWDPNAEYRST
ncbi:MAG: hypothetical protein EXS37_07205, partial [Opitutus sp.]|nr:hypothetical protein [Opitutus sp.]